MLGNGRLVIREVFKSHQGKKKKRVVQKRGGGKSINTGVLNSRGKEGERLGGMSKKKKRKLVHRFV